MFCKFIKTVFLLFLFVLLLMCCAVGEAASAEVAPTASSNTIVLFKSDTDFEKKKNGEPAPSEPKEKFESFTSPSLSYVEGLLVVFAQAKKNGGGGNTKCDIVEGYINLKNNGKAIEEVFKEAAGASWTKRVVIKNPVKECAKNITTVVNNTDIYVFFNNSSDTTQDNDMKYFVIGGKFESQEKQIKWNASSEDVNEILKSTNGASAGIVAFAAGGSGIVVNKTLVFPVTYKKSNSDFASIITNTSDTGGKWKLVLGDSFTNEKYPAVVEWGEKLIIMTSCSDGYRKVYESSNMGVKWKEAVGSISGVWGNSEGREKNEYGGVNGFITANIGEKGREKKVILVTQPVKTESADNFKLHLWMYDYQRVHDVGAIADNVKQKASSTLLYTQENLFVAYETVNEQKATISIKHLKAELDKIKDVLQKWKEQDEKLSKSCIAADGTIKVKDDKCKNTIPTNGLVGLLSDDHRDGEWVDKYMCVSATVNKKPTVTKENNSLKFSGAGAGATWPVGAQGQNQRYHFANYGFTLVATVKIGSEAKDKNSILGIVHGDGNDKSSIGLWCTKEGNWSVSEKNKLEFKTVPEKCEKDKNYQVAFVFDSTTVVLYVDGKKLNELSKNTITTQQPLNVTHFYFGADIGANDGAQEPQSTDDESHMTITNVLLYNQPFGENEIKKLKEYVKPPKVIKNQDENKDTGTQGGEVTSTPQPKISEEKAPSPSRTEDGGVGGGVRVFSLLLAVLCVSAPLLHL